MKRINLSVNIEGNELFEESVKEALLGQARQIAREAIQQELENEIDRITNSKLDEVKNSQYYNAIAKRITEILVKRLGDELTVDTSNVNKMIEEKVGYYLDRRLESRGGLDSFIEAYIEKSIASALMKKIQPSI